MNHRYSTIALIGILLLFLVFQATAYLTSDEIDGGFNCSDNSILYKYNSSVGWTCANLLDTEVFNITVNNITNLYNNYSLYSNQSTYCSNPNNIFNQVLNTTSNVNFREVRTTEGVIAEGNVGTTGGSLSGNSIYINGGELVVTPTIGFSEFNYNADGKLFILSNDGSQLLEYENGNMSITGSYYGDGSQLTGITTYDPRNQSFSVDKIGLQNQTPLYPLYFSGNLIPNYLMYLNVTKDTVGTFSPLRFYASIVSQPIAGTTILPAIYATVDTYADNKSNQFIEGMRYEIGKNSLTQSMGSRTLRGLFLDMAPSGTTANSNGTTIVNGVDITYTPTSAFVTSDGSETFKGIAVTRASQYFTIGSRKYSSFGLYLSGFDKGTNEYDSKAIYVADGTSRFDDAIFFDDIRMAGAGTDIISDNTLELYPNNQTSIALAISNTSANLTLSSSGTQTTEFLKDVVIDGNLRVYGNVSFKRAYGEFSDNGTQTIADSSLAYPVLFNKSMDSYLITLTGKENFSIQQSGNYLIEISALVTTTTGSNKHIYLWLQKNGVDVPDSNTQVEIPVAGVDTVIAVPFILELTPSDKFRFMWGSDTTAAQLLAVPIGASPTRPAVPSVILTVSKISEIV